MTEADHIHGGAVVSFKRNIAFEAPLTTGHHTLEIWGTSTRFDDAPARIDVHLGEHKAASLTVEAGPSQRWDVGFTVDEPGWREVQLRFVNDAVDGGLDRNVHIDTVRILRPPGNNDRAERLRSAIAGSNLLFVSIDTLRADHVHAYGYPRRTTPHIDYLARRGVRFDNAVAAEMWTLPSHATMFTGLHPVEHGAWRATDPHPLSGEAVTLAEQLQSAGYATGGFAGGRWVTSRMGMNQGFDHWENDATWKQSLQDASHRFESVKSWLEKLETRPFFAFAHLYQVHAPYDPPERFDVFRSEAERAVDRQRIVGTFEGELPTPTELSAQVALYDGDILATDTALGELMQWMDQEGWLDNTLVIITSDHGEEFFEHGWVGHGTHHGEVIRVPLVLWHKNLRPWSRATIDSPTGGVDLFPTILDLLGVAYDTPVSGTSLVGTMTGPDSNNGRIAYSGSAARYSMLDSKAHYGEEPQSSWLYALPEDRAERFPVTDEAASYRSRLTEWRDSLVPRFESSPVELTEDERRALEALGYL